MTSALRKHQCASLNDDDREQRVKYFATAAHANGVQFAEGFQSPVEAFDGPVPARGVLATRGCGDGNNPTVWPPYHRSPVAFNRHPARPAFPSNPLHRKQTGSTTRSQAPSLWWTVSAQRPGAVRPQKMHTMTAPPYTAARLLISRRLAREPGWNSLNIIFRFSTRNRNYNRSTPKTIPAAQIEIDVTLLLNSGISP